MILHIEIQIPHFSIMDAYAGMQRMKCEKPGKV